MNRDAGLRKKQGYHTHINKEEESSYTDKQGDKGCGGQWDQGNRVSWSGEEQSLGEPSLECHHLGGFCSGHFLHTLSTSTLGPGEKV